MKRLMAICVAAFTLWFPIAADAASLIFDQLQHRKYEDGTDINRISFSFKDQSGNLIIDNIVKSVELSDPDGIVIQLSNIVFNPFYKALYGSYDAQNGKWNYGSSFSSAEPYYSLNFNESLKSGQYHLKVTDNSNIVYDADRTFNGEIVTLPVISSKSFYAYRDSSGNLIWTWSRPSDLDTGLNTSVRAFVSIYNNDQYMGELYVTVPTHLGYLFVPNDVYQKVLAEGSIFKLGIQLRTNDNQNRSYSKFPIVEEAGTAFFDVNSDGQTGLPEAIHCLQITSGLK
ncbi:MAG: hypothetical protein AB7S75_15955 [Desulfococcaceae bacterium]